MKVSLVFFGFILNSVLACQSINTNSICNVYSNIQVDNAQDLESNVKSHSNLTSQLEKFKCPSLVTKLQTNKLTATLRYLRTFECQLHISNSTCKTETSNQQICYSSCMTFLMSLQAAFSNPDLCDQNPGWAINNQRSYFVNSISSICSASVTLKTCVPAIKLEAKNCGFGNDESGIKSANEWCKSQQGDPCCLSGIESINDDSGASPNGSTSTSTSNYLTIALVVGLICCLLIIAFAYFYFSRKSPKDKTKTKRISTSINPSNNEKSVPSTLQTPSMESLQMALSSTKPSTSNFGKQDSKASEDTRNSTASDANVMIRRRSIAANSPESNSKMAVYVSQVIQDYEAANPDEMSLHIGDKISISCVFADGWGQGKNETTDETGLFPVVCVSSI